MEEIRRIESMRRYEENALASGNLKEDAAQKIFDGWKPAAQLKQDNRKHQPWHTPLNG